MTRYLLAGGGTAGHVNPLLAVADAIMADEPDSTILVLGTAEGLEARLVPDRGYELSTIAKLPFPRRPNRAALQFLPRFNKTISDVRALIRERRIDAVVGFGGYVSTPAYLAAHREHIPIAIHEANAKPGLANKLGARYTKQVGVAFDGTPIRNGRLVGMPLRVEIEQLDIEASRSEAIGFFGLDPARPTLVVTGGSLGARRINETIVASAEALTGAGWQVLHITGNGSDIVDPEIAHFNMLRYCDRMDLALAAADFVVSRAGAATVSELTALGLPAAYVPYPVGNGEQRFNAAGVIESGGGVIVDDASFTPEWISANLLPLLADPLARERMAGAAVRTGIRDGSTRMLALVHEAVAAGPGYPSSSA